MARTKSQSNTKHHQMDDAASLGLTVDEAHELLGKDKISRGAFYAAIFRKEVPHVRIGHRIIIPRAAFMKWLESAGQTTSHA